MANPLASVSISLRSLHDETPDPFDLCGGLALLLGRQATRLDIRRPDWRQINPRIRRDVADRLCVAYDHELDIGMREGLEGLTQALVFKCDRRPLTLIAAGRNGQSETSPLCASRDHEQYERLDREGLRLYSRSPKIATRENSLCPQKAGGLDTQTPSWSGPRRASPGAPKTRMHSVQARTILCGGRSAPSVSSQVAARNLVQYVQTLGRP